MHVISNVLIGVIDCNVVEEESVVNFFNNVTSIRTLPVMLPNLANPYEDVGVWDFTRVIGWAHDLHIRQVKTSDGSFNYIYIYGTVVIQNSAFYPYPDRLPNYRAFTTLYIANCHRLTHVRKFHELTMLMLVLDNKFNTDTCNRVNQH